MNNDEKQSAAVRAWEIEGGTLGLDVTRREAVVHRARELGHKIHPLGYIVASVAEPVARTSKDHHSDYQNAQSPASPAVPDDLVSVGHQFQGRDGNWNPFIDQQHYLNTKDNGSWPIREIFAAAQQKDAKP